MDIYSDGIENLNNLGEDKLYQEFFRCCGSPEFARRMTASRPFTDINHLKDLARRIWYSVPVEQWLLAFSAHPKIGDAKALKAKFSHPKSWEGDEQSGANSASAEVLDALHQLNIEYEVKNGFIFLICATGKSALEMLQALQARMQNDRETEVQIAAGEQAKITNLRLVKLLDSLVSMQRDPIRAKL